MERGRDAVMRQGRGADLGSWRHALLAEWSATRHRMSGNTLPGGIHRLTVRPRVLVRADRRDARDVARHGEAVCGRDHVEHSAGGDVKLRDLPMVDQGDKGYCVVASVERVMRYYGAAVDQHELAQVANSDAAIGTVRRHAGVA